MAREMRERLSTLRAKMGERVVTRNGATYTMKTGKIGKKGTPRDDSPWLRAAIEDGERLREALLRVENGERALAYTDLALGEARLLLAGVGEAPLESPP